MSDNSKLRQRARKVLAAPTESFVELVQISGLDPKKHFVGANLRGVDFGCADLRGFDFRGADLRGAALQDAIYSVTSFSGAVVDRETSFNVDVVPMDVRVSMPVGHSLQSNVVSFTPAGDEIVLPSGSSYIDFAYAIHTELGNEMLGAEADGKKRPIWSRITDGETVNILREHGRKPREEWLDYVETEFAHRKIRSALNRASVDRLVEAWRGEFRDRFPKLAADKSVEDRFSHLSYLVLSGISYNSIRGKRERHSLFCAAMLGLISDNRSGTIFAPITGLGRGVALQLCPLCIPTPNDRIVGISTKHFVEVHSISCGQLEKYEKNLELWLDLTWDDTAKAIEKALEEFDEHKGRVVNRVRQITGRRMKGKVFSSSKETAIEV